MPMDDSSANEKADLKSRSDSTSVPPLDSIYTTPTGFHHQHHHHHHPHHAAHHPHQNGTPGSPEAMKTPNSETDCTVKESLTDGGSTAGSTGSPPPGEGCGAAGPKAPVGSRDAGDSGEGASSQSQGSRQGGQGLTGTGPAEVDDPAVRLPSKVSDYGLERFNRLLDRLDRGNFLIKTSFKKSYSLILMSRSSAGLALGSDRGRVGETVRATTEEEQASAGGGKGDGGSVPAGSTSSDAPTMVNDSCADAATIPPRDPVPGAPEVTPKAADTECSYNGTGLTQSGASAGGAKDCHSSTNESDEFCRSEVYDNESGSGDRTEQPALNNCSADGGGRRQRSPRKPSSPHGNYENIRPSGEDVLPHWAQGESGSRTLGHSYRKSAGRRKSNAPAMGKLTWGAYEDGDDDDDDDEGWSRCEESERLSVSLPHADGEFLWQSGTAGAVPIQFFQRQDYAQPSATFGDGLDFPAGNLDQSTGATRGKRQGRKRWLGGGSGNKKSQFTSVTISSTNSSKSQPDSTGQETGNKIAHDRSFQLPVPFAGANGGKGRGQRSEKLPQLKNINLNFPNKTSLQQLQQYQQQQQQDYDGFHPQQHELTTAEGVPAILPPGTRQAPHGPGKSERKYFNKAKSHFLKLGQKCRLVLAVGGGVGADSGRPRSGSRGQQQQQQHHHHQHISSYNLDDLIKATHKYEENESANLSQKIVYKSYKSELDLTKNLAYLDSFLNEHFDQESGAERRPAMGRQPRHKRAKSCTKSLDPSVKVRHVNATGDGRLEAVGSNLIQLEDVWSGAVEQRGARGQWTANNTSSSSSEYLRNNLSTARALAKPDMRPNKGKLRDIPLLTGETPKSVGCFGEEVMEVQQSNADDDDEEDEDDDDEEDEYEDEEYAPDDGRMLLFDACTSTGFMSGPGKAPPNGSTITMGHGGVLVEQYGKNNATSSSLSSSDYASVYSATSSGGNGSVAPKSVPPFKLLATPEEAMSGVQLEHPHGTPNHPQQRAQQQPPVRMKQQMLPANNATNPFITPTAGEAFAGKSIEPPTAAYAQHHRIYNNFLEPKGDAAQGYAGAAGTSPGQPFPVPVSPTAIGASRLTTTGRRVEKNHRLRNAPCVAYGGDGGRHLLPAPTSPRTIDRYDYRVQQTQHPTGSRQLAPATAAVSIETDLTYQEDYLEHYNRALRTSSVGGETATRYSRPSADDRTLQYLQRVRHRKAQVGPTMRHSNPTAENSRNNGLTNENSLGDLNDYEHGIDDEAGKEEEEEVEGKEKGPCVAAYGDEFDADASDEMLLLVRSAPIDIRRNNAAVGGSEHPLLGNDREKSPMRNAFADLQQEVPGVAVATGPTASRKKMNEPLTGSDSGIENDGKHLLSYQQPQQAYDLSSNHLFDEDYPSHSVVAQRHRSTSLAAGLTHHRQRKTSPAGKGSAAMGNSFLGYGPHRVIVSQSHKERGEVVLEYEC
uniref:Uncharacterized protein n=1 Tax=Anopheles atroparvus TaxID=41427 RepID=A0A182JAD5_ANOAO